MGGLTRESVLDNITLYWLTSTGASAARWYWELGQVSAVAAASGAMPPPVTVIWTPAAALSTAPAPGDVGASLAVHPASPATSAAPSIAFRMSFIGSPCDESDESKARDRAAVQVVELPVSLSERIMRTTRGCVLYPLSAVVRNCVLPVTSCR